MNDICIFSFFKRINTLRIKIFSRVKNREEKLNLKHSWKQGADTIHKKVELNLDIDMNMDMKVDMENFVHSFDVICLFSSYSQIDMLITCEFISSL
jgi:hypothetical protein